MKKFNVLFGFMVCCITMSFGQLYEVPFKQKVDKSEIIVEGEITDQTQILIHGVPHFVNKFSVKTVFKGALTSTNELEVLTFGGRLNDERVFSPHSLSLKKGDKGIFFLSKYTGSSSESNYYSVYAEKQG